MPDQTDVKLAELAFNKAVVEKERAAIEASGKRGSSIIQFVIGGAITAGLAAGGTYIASRHALQEAQLDFQKENRVIDLELARLSLTILAGDYDEKEERSLPARRFALDALEKGIGVDISDSDKDIWARTGITPNIEANVVVQQAPAFPLEMMGGGLERVLPSQSSFPSSVHKLFGCVASEDGAACGIMNAGPKIGEFACLESVLDGSTEDACGELLNGAFSMFVRAPAE